MGGCASRPKDLDVKQKPLLAPEEPDTPNKAEVENVPQENNGGETTKEEPSVESSEPAPKSEEPSAESKPAEAEALSAEAKPSDEAAKPTDDKVEVAAETKEAVKAAEEKPEGDAGPSSENKTDALVVTL